MNRYEIVQDIVNQLTVNPVFRTFFTLYLMADSEEERVALDARFWRDASELDDKQQQLLHAELARTFTKLPELINRLHEKVTVTMV